MGQFNQGWALTSDHFIDLHLGQRNAASGKGQAPNQPNRLPNQARRLSRARRAWPDANGPMKPVASGERTMQMEQNQFITSAETISPPLVPVSTALPIIPQAPCSSNRQHLTSIRVPPVVMASSVQHGSPGLHTFSGEVSRNIEGPSAQQWQELKEEIKDLYSRKPLKEVRAILFQRYGFRATDRMFKSRLSTWGFSKNSRDHEYQICAILHRVRKQQGKTDTLFVINGKRRSLRDLRKYIKGRKMTEDEFVALAERTFAEDNESTEPLQDQSIRAITPPAEGEDPEGMEGDARGDSSEPEPGLDAGIGVGAGKGTFTGASNPPPYYPTHAKDGTPTNAGPLALSGIAQGITLPKQVSYNSRQGSHGIPLHASRTQPSLAPAHFNPSKRPTTSSSTGLAQSPTIPTSPHSLSPNSMALSQDRSPSRRRRRSSHHDALPECQYYDQYAIDVMAYETVHCSNLEERYRKGDLQAYRLLQGTSSSDSESDYNIICPSCNELISSHFRSLSRFNDSSNFIPSPTSSASPPSGSPYNAYPTPISNPPARSLFHPSPDIPQSAPSIPTSQKEHDHSWKWVSRCYLACILLSRWKTNPARNPEAEKLAEQALEDAKLELEAMISGHDDKIVLTLSQTLMVLQMHDQGDICRRIMTAAMEVAERVTDEGNVLRIMTRFMVLACDPRVLKADGPAWGITSETMRACYEGVVATYSPNGDRAAGERDLRALGMMYIWAYMLNLECSRDLDKDKHARDQVKIRECERIMRRCYQLSVGRLGKGHLLSIQCLINLRLCLERQVLEDGSDRLDEAIEVAEKVCRDSLPTLGKSHPRRLETMRSLAVSLLERDDPGDVKKAEGLYHTVLVGRFKMLGRDHIWTQGMKTDYVNLLESMGKWVDGSPEKEEVEDLFEWDMIASDSEDEVNAGAF